MEQKYFKDCESLDELAAKKKEIYEMFGLYNMPAIDYPRKAVDREFHYLKIQFEDKDVNSQSSFAESEVKSEPSLQQIVDEVKKWNCEKEICGQWLWLSGPNTYPHFDDLKKLGFRYAKGKKAWYWRPDKAKSNNPEPKPMDYIREKYGSKAVALA